MSVSPSANSTRVAALTCTGIDSVALPESCIAASFQWAFGFRGRRVAALAASPFGNGRDYLRLNGKAPSDS